MKPVSDSIRRAALAALAVSCALGAARPAAAGDAELAPEKMILELSTNVLDTLKSDKQIRSGDFERVQKLVDERIMPHVDFDKMTRLAVGRPWRGASAEQRSALSAQFRTLLMRTYSGALARVSDQSVRLRPTRTQDNSNDVIVRTQIVASQGDPIDLDYRMEKTTDGWKIYDLNILGVWLVENYKNEFTATLSQSGVDGLIQALTEKNRRLAAGSGKTS